jgi:hypothetical protein
MLQETDYHTMGAGSHESRAAYDQSNFHWPPTDNGTAFRSPHYPSGNVYYNNLNENWELTQSEMCHYPILSPKPSYKCSQDRNRELERELAVQRYFRYLLTHIC